MTSSKAGKDDDSDPDYIKHEHGSIQDHQPRKKRGKPCACPCCVAAGAKVAADSVRTADFRQYLYRVARNVVKKFSEGEKGVKQDMAGEIQTKSRRCEELHQKLEEKDHAMQEMSRECLQRLNERGQDAEDDDAIRTKLTGSTNDLKSWAKKYGRAIHIINLDYSTKKVLTQALLKEPHPIASKDTIEVLFEQKISAATILNGLLAKHISSQMIDSPFFFLRNVITDGVPIDLATAIMRAYEIGNELNPDHASAWLRHTMSLFIPRRTSNPMTPSKQNEIVEASKRAFYREYSRSFLEDESVRLLLQDLGDAGLKECFHRLLSCLSDFGDYLLQLATQKARMKVLAYDCLKNIDRSSNGNLIQLHSSYGGDTTETLANCRTIILVVVPAIVAYGDEDGRNYDSHKVWRPAIVMVRRETTASTSPAQQKSSDLAKSGLEPGKSADYTIKREDEIEAPIPSYKFVPVGEVAESDQMHNQAQQVLETGNDGDQVQVQLQRTILSENGKMGEASEQAHAISDAKGSTFPTNRSPNNSPCSPKATEYGSTKHTSTSNVMESIDLISNSSNSDYDPEDYPEIPHSIVAEADDPDPGHLQQILSKRPLDDKCEGIPSKRMRVEALSSSTEETQLQTLKSVDLLPPAQLPEDGAEAQDCKITVKVESGAEESLMDQYQPC